MVSRSKGSVTAVLLGRKAWFCQQAPLGHSIPQWGTMLTTSVVKTPELRHKAQQKRNVFRDVGCGHPIGETGRG